MHTVILLQLSVCGRNIHICQNCSYSQELFLFARTVCIGQKCSYMPEPFIFGIIVYILQNCTCWKCSYLTRSAPIRSPEEDMYLKRTFCTFLTGPTLRILYSCGVYTRASPQPCILMYHPLLSILIDITSGSLFRHLYDTIYVRALSSSWWASKDGSPLGSYELRCL